MVDIYVYDRLGRDCMGKDHSKIGINSESRLTARTNDFNRPCRLFTHAVIVRQMRQLARNGFANRMGILSSLRRVQPLLNPGAGRSSGRGAGLGSTPGSGCEGGVGGSG